MKAMLFRAAVLRNVLKQLIEVRVVWHTQNLESSIFPMPTHWTILFRAALRQQDPAKPPKLVEQARRFINDRVLERGTKSADPQDKEELEEALRQLTLLEQKRKSEPRAKSARPE
jgi:hypothetical protein